MEWNWDGTKGAISDAIRVVRGEDGVRQEVRSGSGGCGGLVRIKSLRCNLRVFKRALCKQRYDHSVQNGLGASRATVAVHCKP